MQNQEPVPCRSHTHAILWVAVFASLLWGGVADARICGEPDVLYPSCIGDCFAPGTMCQPAASGVPECACEPRPCELSFGPTCDGPCPDPTQPCQYIPSLGSCRCEPDLACDHSAYPSCDGGCPTADLACVPSQVAGATGCTCEPIACEQSPAPTCGGACPNTTQTCVFDNLTSHCICDPPPGACQDSPLSACDGECPGDEICILDPVGCNCYPTPCDQSPHPTCDGACPDGTHCKKDPSGLAACVCQPIVCERSGAPTCDGPCPQAGQTCNHIPATGECRCEPDTLLCEDSPIPGSCSGWCPTTSPNCIFDASMQHCRCDPPPPPPCDQAPYATCDGECPDGTICVPDSTGIAVCHCEPVPCELTGLPECEAPCDDPNQECTFIAADNTCRCKPKPLACDTSAYPQCNGDCPPGTQTVCVPNTTGVAGCSCQPIPCEQSLFPGCDGACPDGTFCWHDPLNPAANCQCEPLPCELAADPTAATCNGPCDDPSQTCNYIDTIDECRCQPEIVICDSSAAYPICDAECPTGQHCVPGATLVPPIPSCVCEDIACELSQPGVCDGPCQNGGTCLPNSATGVCYCDPPPQQCELDLFQGCLGECPDGEVCQFDPTTPQESCHCVPVLCDESPFPQCNGICPLGTVCHEDPRGIAGCTCVETPCEELPIGAVCDAPCPQPGQQCVTSPLTGQCACDPPMECEQAPYPSCDLSCPPGQRCVPGKFGHCRCIDIVCENTIAPTCDGPCPHTPPQDCTFIPSLGACRCQPVIVLCDETPHPVCDGVCPQGTVCVPVPSGIPDGAPFCDCRPIPPPACAQALHPVCNGTCPPGYVCDPNTVGTLCKCRCIIVPPWDDIHVAFISTDTIIWNPNPCAHWYNLYRVTVAQLVDSDGDGLPDPDYGSCFQSHIMATEADDTSTPDPGYMHVYTIVGVNDVGPGSLGYTSAGLERLPQAPCP